MALFPVLDAQPACSDVPAAAPTPAALFPVVMQAPESQGSVHVRDAEYGSNGSSSASESSSGESTGSRDKAVDEYGRMRGGTRPRSSSRRKSRKRKKHRDRDRDRGRDRDRAKGGKRNKRTHKKHKREQHDVNIEFATLHPAAAAAPTSVFSLDTIGERQHVQLDSIYSGSVPKFTALRRRRHNQAATKSETTSRYFQDHGGRSSKRMRSSTGVGKRRARRDPTSTSPAGPIGVGGDFVALSGEATRDAEVDASADAKGKEEVAMAETEEQRLMRVTKEFNERTRSQPGDEALWLRFAAFQNEFIVLSKRRNKVKGSAAIAAKKIAILHAGIRANPKSERLLYAYLELCSQEWEHGAALAAWRAAVAQHPSSLRLWRRYLRFSIGTFASFSVSAATAAYTQAFKQLNDLVAAALENYSVAAAGEAWRYRDRAAALERVHFGLVLDWCELLQQAGFTERAVGVLQAMVELNWFTPEHLLGAAASGDDSRSAATRLRFFEAFWESEAPRLGDAGSEGWGAWLVKAQERLSSSKSQSATDEVTGPSAVPPASSRDIKTVEDATASKDPMVTNNWVLPAVESAALSNTAGADEAAQLGLSVSMDAGEEWDRSDDEQSDGEAEEERARIEAESDEVVSQRAAIAAAQELEDAESTDIRQLLHWAHTDSRHAARAWQPLTSSTSAAAQEREDKIGDDTESILLFEDVSGALLYYNADPSLRSELGVRLLERIGAPCPASEEHASGYSSPKLPPCWTVLDNDGECGGMFALLQGLQHQLHIQSNESDIDTQRHADSSATNQRAVRGIRREILSVIAYAEACGGSWVSGRQGREAVAQSASADSDTGTYGNGGDGDQTGQLEDQQQWATFVRKIFTQLTAALSTASADVLTQEAPGIGARLCRGWLDFEFSLAAAENPPELEAKSSTGIVAARSVAKSLLAQDLWSSDLGLWRAFGQAEANAGNIKEAQKIFDAAMIAQTSSLTAAQEKFAIRRAYAELEVLQGNTDRALHVLTSGMGSSVSCDDGSGFVSIRPKKAKRRNGEHISAYDSPPIVTPIALATARRAYERVREAATASSGGLGLGGTVHAVVCHALLELLSPAGFQGMRNVFDAALAEIYDPDGQHAQFRPAEPPDKVGSSNSMTLLSIARYNNCSSQRETPRHLRVGCEALYAAYLKYTVAHFAGGGVGGAGHRVVVAPRVIRNIMLRALHAFPGNASFLSYWLLVEGSSQIAANLRAFFHTCCRNDVPGSSEPALWLFAVHFEAQRALRGSKLSSSDSTGGMDGTGSSALRVVNLYERAVACPEIQHYPVIWSAYLSFLLQHYTFLQQGLAAGTISTSAVNAAALGAKRVFFRAIRACGEAKCLWMAAFNVPALRGLMSKKELVELHDLMVEKDIRMHVDLDEVQLPFFSLGGS